MRDSGLLDTLLPDFEQANNVNVQVIAKGSGAALALGQSGDADVLIVHSPAAETTFMNAGYGWNRTQFSHNWFVIVGPANDPAGIKNMTNATMAFKQIYDNKSVFVGRGDDSGTASKELALWNGTGYVAPDNRTMSDWYKSTGQGMLQTLQMANQIGGYTLSDKSTFLQNQKNLTNLVLLVDATPDMINKYDVIEVNATMHPNVKYDLAHKFLQFMISNATQQKISQYGIGTVGQPLFVADKL
jgi:tungstate transport system substrate-binding protein